MADHDLDMVLAIDWSRDEILLGNQRWLTGFIPVGGPAAVLLGQDGFIELITQRIGHPVRSYYQANGFQISLVDAFSASVISERIARHRPLRLGLADFDNFPAVMDTMLRARLPVLELLDVSKEFQRLRLRKTAFELSMIRKSCAISDAVWAAMPEIFKVGRRNYEIIADVDHMVRLKGAEGGFHLVLPMPFLGRPIQSLANGSIIEADARYLMEVSPRYDGYYSQLTVPVSTHSSDNAAERAYEDLVAAKAAAQPRMRPGADLSQVAHFVRNFLSERGHAMTSLSLGHFCGMALEEPRHDPAEPLELEDGMTMIFHPILAEPEFQSMMRADTYLITGTGAERLNRYNGGMLIAC